MSEEASKTSQNQPVDETAYQHMEVVAAASGPEAESRRREMEEWSGSVGHYAETASTAVNNAADIAVNTGSRDAAIKEKMSNANKYVAKHGVWAKGEGADRPIAGGTGLNMERRYGVADGEASETSTVLRSPASFKKDAQESQSVEGASEETKAA